jgi:hypothetical protein
VGEAAAWLLYAIPMLVYVLWPTGKRVARVVDRAAESAAA